MLSLSILSLGAATLVTLAAAVPASGNAYGLDIDGNPVKTSMVKERDSKSPAIPTTMGCI